MKTNQNFFESIYRCSKNRLFLIFLLKSNKSFPQESSWETFIVKIDS